MRNHFFAVLVPLLAGILASASGSPGWTQSMGRYLPLVQSADKLTVLDVNRMERTGTHVLAWIVEVLPEMQGFRYVEARLEIDCPGRRFREVAHRLYDDGHSLLIDSEDVDAWASFKAGSSIDLIAKPACNPASIDGSRAFNAAMSDLVNEYLAGRARDLQKTS